jgi:peptidoglycan L-alanyl-D-glutamate endopeptidase CwlK
LGAGLGIPTAVAQAQGAPGPQPAQQTVAQFEAQLIANNQSPVSQPAPTFDPQTEGHLRQLHPQVEALAREHLLELWSAGLKPQITQSYRSIAAQNALYAQGRTTPGAIVTNARGGSSLHNYRLAYDIGLFNSYNGAFSGYISNGLDPSYTLAGKMGQDVGLTWGGTFTTIYDAPHFQLTWGIPMQDIQARWAAHLDVFTGL